MDFVHVLEYDKTNRKLPFILLSCTNFVDVLAAIDKVTVELSWLGCLLICVIFSGLSYACA